MTDTLKFIGIIPARYASSRFPGKPLVDIRGKSMIRRVYEQAAKALETVCVATDDQRIYDAVKSFAGRVVMTSEQHKSGTDRCAEAVRIAEKETGLKFDVVLNVQGDEPFIEPEQLELVKSCFTDGHTQIATLVREIHALQELNDANRPKVVINTNLEAIYFSRATIPCIRGVAVDSWPERHIFYAHVGLYGFRRHILTELTALQQSPLELAESLEQLRWIENGYRISVRVTTHENFSIDTPEDLEQLLRRSDLFENGV